MSEQFKMLVCLADGVDLNGDICTPAALLSLAVGLHSGADISLDFRFGSSVGKIVQAWVRNRELWASIVVTDYDVIEAIREGKLTLRPGFSIEKAHISSDGHQVIEKVGHTALGLMTNGMPCPSDRTCTLCTRSIFDDDTLAICGPCLVAGQA